MLDGGAGAALESLADLGAAVEHLAALSEMARPRIELGTPRFSVVDCGVNPGCMRPHAARISLEIGTIEEGGPFRENPPICGLVDARWTPNGDDGGVPLSPQCRTHGPRARRGRSPQGDASMLGVAAAHGLPTGWRLLVGDVTRLPFPDGRFDVATACYLLHLLDRDCRARAIAEIARVLRVGGRVVTVTADSPEPLRARFVRDGWPSLREAEHQIPGRRRRVELLGKVVPEPVLELVDDDDEEHGSERRRHAHDGTEPNEAERTRPRDRRGRCRRAHARTLPRGSAART